MKIWACAKNKSGFINREEDGRYKLFFIWQVLKLRRENPNEFSTLEFFSTHSRPEKRRPMTPVKNGWFRYKDSSPRKGGEGGDGESVTHMFVIAALAELKTISFVFGEQVVPFTFTRLGAEEAELRFGNGRTYYPDLYGEFTEDNPFYKQWGGKVAIEVCVEHPCENLKVKDCEAHGVPIIEVNVSSRLHAEPHIRSDDLEGSLERYFERTKRILSERVFAKVISSPISVAFHREQLASGRAILEKKLADIELLQVSLRDKDSALKILASEKEKIMAGARGLIAQGQELERKNLAYRSELDQHAQDSTDLRAQLNAELEMGFWGRVTRLFVKPHGICGSRKD